MSGTSDEGTHWRLRVDVARCIGSGACAGFSAHFRMTRDGHAEPREDTITPDESARDAALCCPVEAIRVIDDGGELIAPD